MGGSAVLASPPGDSMTAFPSQNEGESDAQHPPQDDQHNLKDKQSAPPTNASSTAELLPSSAPNRGPPAWLLLLDRHWNPLACLWVGMSLLCIFVLIGAVPTEPIQPAKVAVVVMKRDHQNHLTEECARTNGYMQNGEPELLSTSLAEGDTNLTMNFARWDASPNASTTTTGDQTTTEHHPLNPQVHAQAHAQAQTYAHTHTHHLPPEQLCLLLVALTVFVLPLPGYVLVGGCCWAGLAHNARNKRKERREREKKGKKMKAGEERKGGALVKK